MNGKGLQGRSLRSGKRGREVAKFRNKNSLTHSLFPSSLCHENGRSVFCFCCSATQIQPKKPMKMINRSLLGLSVMLAAGASISYGQLQLLEEWDFTAADPGLRPSEVGGNLGSGLAWNGDGSGQFTTGSSLRVSHDSNDLDGWANSHVDLRNHPDFANFHTWRVEYDFGGWNFEGDQSDRRLSTAFVAGDGSFLFAANASIRYFEADPNPLTLRGEAFGTGGSGGTPALPGEPIDNWSPERTDPVSLRVDHTHDPANGVFHYSVFYDNGDGFQTLVDQAATSSERTKYYVRIGAFGDDWGDSFIDIDGMRVYAVPEPSTYALILGLGFGAFVLWRRRRGKN